MSTFTKFAVVGAGGVGSGIVDGLLKANATVTILTRDDSKAELQAFKDREASLAKVNYEDALSLKTALAGSEFGMQDEDGPNAMKQQVRDLLKELNLPFALFHGGLWAEYMPFFLGCNFEKGIVTVAGEGDAKLSISSLEWSRFSVESDRMSPKEIAAVAEKKLGKKVELQLVSYEETKKTYATDSVAYISTRIADGRCVSGTQEEAKETVARFYPDWNPTPYETFIA
ncbi:hypothetical protein PHYSODRAFT_313811 [Phytophthora sojae]|uniref:NmrA-like domain-containing protein n=1 Tax=Phytophthora sojae (strain P6497) TaxID=1094619 RepID=G4Z6C4_PHYSP|nr:hypothetical protein PHYSODRAFT_313811 [Phytophthora sojae]EGZ21739.1 hypothetical protein PHYSODRAFT_313811 [Phytophthora sojae]|eukprot:XP_009524456.1 hypothetical protein PHYSODRAFT_313811 [Phytophthora sojae]